MQRLLWRAFLPEKAARTFLQQQNHFLSSAAAAKNRLKPGLCSCSANARRPDRPGSGSYRGPALASKNHPLFSACHDIGNAKKSRIFLRALSQEFTWAWLPFWLRWQHRSPVENCRLAQKPRVWKVGAPVITGESWT